MEAIINDFKVNINSNNKFSIFQKIKFVFHFITKIFLYCMFLILIIVGILFLLYFCDMIYNLKKGEYKPPLFNAYIIVSPSMVPTIKVEDAIVIKREDVNSIKVGDIITFNSSDPRYSGLTITHRVVKIDKSTEGKLLFKTKGDNNNTEDMAYAQASDIYGKVILKIPKLGYIQYFLSQSYGWLLAIVIPCLSVIAYDIVKLLKGLGLSIFGKNKHNESDNSHLDEPEILKENMNNIKDSVVFIDETGFKTNEILENINNKNYNAESDHLSINENRKESDIEFLDIENNEIDSIESLEESDYNIELLDDSKSDDIEIL